MTKRKSRKRKRLQIGGTVEYGEGVSRVALAQSSMVQSAKKARSGCHGTNPVFLGSRAPIAG
jgi:hypothetical protein